MRFLFLLFLGFSGLASVPTLAANKCCYCEIDTVPAQRPLFIAGCKSWLKAQNNCEVKSIVDHGTSYANRALSCAGGELSVGYVGHWRDTRGTINYLEDIIIPAIHRHRISVKVENTGCNSLDQPDWVLHYIHRADLKGKTLKVRGNQQSSIGKWDVVLGSSYNLYADVDSTKNWVQYPACDLFRGKNCVLLSKPIGPGQCREKNGNLAPLTCCRSFKESTAAGFQKMFRWSDPRECLD